jgi:parallel beta-helix repeat protein
MAPRSSALAHARHQGHLAGLAQRLLVLLGAAILAIVTLGMSGAGSPVDAACGSFQSRVNAAASGSTITIPACTYNESVSIRKPLTINASGAVIDGQNTRSTGLAVFANDVTVNGLTVKRVKSATHGGAVWTTGDIARFTFRNGRALSSSTICVSLNGGSGHRILGSVLAGCGKEGYFLNNVSNVLFEGNDIHSNNAARAFDPGVEAGGGKTMASQSVTFRNNRVHHNGGPGIWFDGGVKSATVTGNRVYDNARDGIYFEISDTANISGNVVWNNGHDDPAWGYGAGITVSSSDRAVVSGNTVAWNARGISVISQARQLRPHTGNLVRDNNIIQRGTGFVAGFYEDHDRSLFASSSGNGGSGNRYWVGGGEPSTDRFNWNGPKSRLSDYNATPGEQGRYLTTGERDAILASAGITSGSIKAPVPALRFRSGQLSEAGTTPGRITWSSLAGATAYQAQVRRDGGSWVNATMASSKSLQADFWMGNGSRYDIRLRAKQISGIWTAWRSGAGSTMVRLSETTPSIAYAGTWRRVARSGAIGGYTRSTWSRGATATLRFEGRAIALVAPLGPLSGKADVVIDGRTWTIDLYRSSTASRRVIFTMSWPTSGTHTLTFRNRATSGHPRIDLDAITVLR